MDTFLTTILILLLVFLGLKIAFRFALPYFMKYITKKAAQKMENAFRESASFNQNSTKEKKPFTFSKPNQKKSKAKKPVGEYIDFEEID